MKSLSASELLQCWDEGLDRPLLDRMLRLLSKVYSVDYAEVCRLSIGERDARLLLLRERLFGLKLKNIAPCPQCKVITEWEAKTEELHLQQLPSLLSDKKHILEQEGYLIQFRLPDSNDLIIAMFDKSRLVDQKKIMADCVYEVSHLGKKIHLDEVPNQMWSILDQKMSEEDPQADINILINCPACSHQWTAKFDIMSYLWAEINNWAQKIMQEIVYLARAFGWSEEKILNMSARRRQLYLQMLGA